MEQEKINEAQRDLENNKERFQLSLMESDKATRALIQEVKHYKSKNHSLTEQINMLE